MSRFASLLVPALIGLLCGAGVRLAHGQEIYGGGGGSGSGGNVVGPGPLVVDNSVPVFVGTDGVTIEDTPVLINPANGNVTGVGDLTLTGTGSVGTSWNPDADGGATLGTSALSWLTIDGDTITANAASVPDTDGGATLGTAALSWSTVDGNAYVVNTSIEADAADGATIGATNRFLTCRVATYQADTAVNPDADGGASLGTAALSWLGADIDTVVVNTAVNPDIDGGATLGTPSLAYSNAYIQTLQVNTSCVPDADGGANLGTAGLSWLTVDGDTYTANTAMNPDADGGASLGTAALSWVTLDTNSITLNTSILPDADGGADLGDESPALGFTKVVAQAYYAGPAGTYAQGGIYVALADGDAIGDIIAVTQTTYTNVDLTDDGVPSTALAARIRMITNICSGGAGIRVRKDGSAVDLVGQSVNFASATLAYAFEFTVPLAAGIFEMKNQVSQVVCTNYEATVLGYYR